MSGARPAGNRGRPKKQDKKKPQGSGVIAGPAIKNGWGAPEGQFGIGRATSKRSAY